MLIVGGSDAGISAALRAREVDSRAEVRVVLADAYPNFSICGIPYLVSREVDDWHDLAHRTAADLEAAGITLTVDTMARRIDPARRRLLVSGPDGEDELAYETLIIGTGAVPIRPAIEGLDGLGSEQGVHLLHSMSDTFALIETLERPHVGQAVIVGGGYIGLEMADALATRGLFVTLLEQLPEVLPTVDPELGALVHTELERHGVTVSCGTRVQAIIASGDRCAARLAVRATGPGGERQDVSADVVLVVVGVRPDTELAASAGVELGLKGAIAVDREMRTSVPGIFAAGDCVVTHHRLLGPSYLPLGTTAHKQGRIAGENALGGGRRFAGSLGTQVVKIFELVAARTGLRDHEAIAVGFSPLTVAAPADDHKAYYPGAHPVEMRYTGDARAGRLLGLQLVGHVDSEIAKRVDIAAAAIHAEMTLDVISDLDLSYTPPLGSPWDALQTGAQAWTRAQSRIAPEPRRQRPRDGGRERAA